MTLVVATLIALAANPAVIGQYLSSIVGYPPNYWITPTLGSLLRLVFGADRFWLQFVPLLLGTAWFIFYWRRHREPWSWAEQLPVLLLVCLITTAYGWEYDQIVLMLAVIQVAVWTTQVTSRLMTIMVWSSFLVVTLLALSINVLQLSAFWYVWMPPTYLLWYLVARKHLGSSLPRHRRAGGPQSQSLVVLGETDS